MEKTIQIRYNIMDVSSVNAFGSVSGGFRQNCKDVYFLRFLGMNDSFLRDLSEMERQLQNRQFEKKGLYKHIDGLAKLCSQEDIVFYTECYENWVKNSKKVLNLKNSIQNDLLKEQINQAFIETGKYLGNENVSIQKNFYVKLMYWFDNEMAYMLLKWQPQLSMKVVASNVTKKQEYLFFYLLTQCGFDVLLIQNEQDIDSDLEQLLLSKKYLLGTYGTFDWPKERKTETNKIQAQPVLHEVTPSKSHIRKEKSYEELALLASSVVQIRIHNENGEIESGGSGIMIGSQGYILTNYHVACGGRRYSVVIEEDETIYWTEELIKYNAQLDLAIIRIDRQLNPLPIYNGQDKLVRGQKVVAIGSPLGLFNSISDGIISGFRKMRSNEHMLWDSIEMIQFTAPISGGSSGGAVLNMYGEVIGITTASADIGQNINLAVGYQDINPFIRGFIS